MSLTDHSACSCNRLAATAESLGLESFAFPGVVGGLED